MAMKRPVGGNISNEVVNACLLLTSVALLYVPMGTRLYPIEVVAVGLLPVTASATWSNYRALRIVMVAGVFWACCSAVQELTLFGPGNALGAALTPTFFVCDLCLVIWLFESVRHRWKMIVMFCLAVFMFGLLQPERGVESNTWKFWLAIPICIPLLGIANRALDRRKRLVAGSICLLTALANFIGDYRSLAGIVLCAAMLALTNLRERKDPRRVRAEQVVKVGAALMCAGWVASMAYSFVIAQGMLSQQFEDRYISQASGEYGLLLAGRKEAVPMLLSIADSPILGVGESAGLARETYEKTLAFYTNAGYRLDSVDLAYLGQTPFPAHSVILGSWFHNGISALLFWALLTRVVLLDYLRRNLSSLAAGAVACWIVWTLLFSPLGGGARWGLAFAIGWLVTRRPSVSNPMEGAAYPGMTGGGLLHERLRLLAAPE